MNELAARACTLLEENGITAYNERPTRPRAPFVHASGLAQRAAALCFVVNGNGLPNEAEICATLQKEFALTTILVNRNSERTNVIFGPQDPHRAGPRRH